MSAIKNVIARLRYAAGQVDLKLADDAEAELASLKKELDSLRSIIEETIEALEEHNLTRTLQAIKSDYEDAKKGIYKGKGI